MNTLIYMAILSFAGASFLISRKTFCARAMPREEFEEKLNGTAPVFHDISARIIVPFVVFLHDTFSPKIYKEFEIIISRFRINVLRAERQLLHLANYIRGKREVKISEGNHPYWNQLGNSEADKKEENKQQ